MQNKKGILVNKYNLKYFTFFVEYFIKIENQTYNNISDIIRKNINNLQGRVKFSTGGKAHERKS